MPNSPEKQRRDCLSAETPSPNSADSEAESVESLRYVMEILPSPILRQVKSGGHGDDNARDPCASGMDALLKNRSGTATENANPLFNVLDKVDQTTILTAALRRSSENIKSCHKAIRALKQQTEKLKKSTRSKIDKERRQREREEASQKARVELLDQQMRLREQHLRHARETLGASVKQLSTQQRKLRADACLMRETFAASLQQLKHTMEQVSMSNTDKLRADSLQEELLRKEKALQEQRQVAETAAARCREMESNRRKLHDQIQKLRGNIRVLCRVRPLNVAEQKAAIDRAVFAEPHSGTISCVNRPLDMCKSFEYDCVFGPEAEQGAVFDEVDDVVTSVLDGYNACIFAYGQTGSGKTHTMYGYGSDAGVCPRAIDSIFSKIEQRSDDYKSTVHMSLLEVYNEQIVDLMPEDQSLKTVSYSAGSKSKLGKSSSLKTFSKRSSLSNTSGSASSSDISVQGLRKALVTSKAVAHKFVATGLKVRASSATGVHERSSRSHCIFSVEVVSENIHTGAQYFGKLHMVDLAGSECVSKSNVQGQQLRETQNINKSLSALADVFLALANKQKHVPFRNSKLTHLLSDSLGGNSKTLTVVCLNPGFDSLSETTQSLNFALRARTVTLGKAKASKKVAESDA